MPFSMGLTITGLQEAQERNLRRIAALSPRGEMGRAVQWAAGEMHRHLTAATPWETGSLRASRRVTFTEDGDDARAQIFNTSTSYNPRSNTPPHEYDVYLHARGFKAGLRGGIQASFTWTRLKHGQQIVRRLRDRISMELKGI